LVLFIKEIFLTIYFYFKKYNYHLFKKNQLNLSTKLTKIKYTEVINPIQYLILFKLKLLIRLITSIKKRIATRLMNLTYPIGNFNAYLRNFFFICLFT